jgi:hypothetical protein
VTIPLVVLLRLLLPKSISDDGMLYSSLAKDPFDNPLVNNSLNPFWPTFASRLLVPLIVWVLPFSTSVGFHITSMGGIVAGAAVVAVLARKIGVGALALAVGPVYALSFHGIYGLWQWRMVDTVTLAVFAGAILAAYTYRAVLCSLLATAAVASKEVGLAIPICWWAVRRGERPERRALAEAAAIAIAPVGLFVFMRYSGVIPHRSWNAWEQYKLGFTTQGEWGYVRPLAQVFLQNHGLLWMLWPLALLVAPPRWRRLHLFVLALVPFLAGGPWARSVGYLLPFVLPSAMLVLQRASLARALVAIAGSVAVTVPLSLRNIGIDGFESNLLLVPGIVVFLVAAAPVAVDLVRREISRPAARRRAPARST